MELIDVVNLVGWWVVSIVLVLVMIIALVIPIYGSIIELRKKS